MDGNNNITKTYTHNLAIDDPLAMTTNGQTYYYHKDGLGSVVALSDSTGTVVQKYDYDSFGNITSTLNQNFIQPYTFTGREFDPESGLYYLRTRELDSKTGTFTQKDPIGFAGGINLYSYVGNAPTNFVDPFGLFEITVNDTGGRAGDTYGGTMMVIGDNGKVTFVNASTWPNPKNTAPGIATGSYSSVYSATGHKQTTNGVRLKDGDFIPTVGPNPVQKNKWEANGVNIHCGYSQKSRGSTNCITIQPDQCSQVWDILQEGEKGTVTVRRNIFTQIGLWLRRILR